MSEVLIDNWNLYNADVIKNHRGDEIPNEAYSDLLSALVLWDDVYYLDNLNGLDNGISVFKWKYEKKGNYFKEIIKPLCLDLNIKTKFEDAARTIYNDNYEQKYSKVIAQRAIFYGEICRACQIDYFPFKKRSDFIYENMDIIDYWTRNELIKVEEKEILSRIREFNNSYYSAISFPILAKLIVKNSNSSTEYIKTALEIKATNEVIQFRKYMDKIDRDINKGDVKELRYALSLIPEIVNDIQKMDKKLKICAEIKLKISPSVISMLTGTILASIYTESELLKMGMFCGTIGELFKESKIEIIKQFSKSLYPKKIQTTFLRSLAQNVLV